MPKDTRFTLRGRIGAHTLHSRYDSRELTAPARRAAGAKLEQQLLDEVDPDRVLSTEERARRVDHARKAHFARLAMKSAAARRSKERSR